MANPASTVKAADVPNTPPRVAPPGARMRRAAFIAALVILVGAVAFILWPVPDGLTSVAGDFRPHSPADYLFQLRQKVSPLHAPTRAAGTPGAPTTR